MADAHASPRRGRGQPRRSFPESITEEQINENGETIGGEKIDVLEPAETEEQREAQLQAILQAEQAAESGPPRKYYVDNAEVRVLQDVVLELDEHGKKLRTVSYTDYTREQVRKLYPSASQLRSKWTDAEEREHIIEALKGRGVELTHLAEATHLENADPFDLLVHIAYNGPLRSRRERAERVRKGKMDAFDYLKPEAREVLDLLLEKYNDHGVDQLSDLHILEVPPISERGTPVEIAKLFGGVDALRKALNRLQDLPEWFFFEADCFQRYIYHEKLLDKTWEHLSTRRLVTSKTKPYDGKGYVATNACALMLMSVLAETCAGTVKRPVTDEWGAYAAMSRYWTAGNHGVYGNGAQHCDDILAAVPATSLNLDVIPLASLIRLRKKELGAGGGVYRDLRHNFLKRIEDHLRDTTTKPYTKGQMREIRRQFKEELRADYEDLALELGVPAMKAFSSKEVAAVVTLSAQAASFWPLIIGGAVKLAGLVGVGKEYRSARRRILRGHITSYVYLAEKGRFEWDLR